MSFNLIKITWIDIIKDWVIHGIAQHFCNTLEITRSLVHEPWLLLNLIIIVQLYTFAELKRKRSQRSFHLWKRNLLGKTARDNIEWLPNWPTCILFTKTLFFTFCLQKYEEITYILLLFDNCPCSIRSHQKTWNNLLQNMHFENSGSLREPCRGQQLTNEFQPTKSQSEFDY